MHFADLVALNIKDGSEAWRVKIPPSHGTSMHTRIGERRRRHSPDGNVFRRQRRRHADEEPRLDRAQFAAGAGRQSLLRRRPGARLRSADSAEIPPSGSRSGKGRSIKGGGYWFPSPMLHDGLIYALNASSILSVMDARTGKLVYDQRLEFGGGHCYPSITLAGDRLYVSSDNGNTSYLSRAASTRSSPAIRWRRFAVRWCSRAKECTCARPRACGASANK